jgi:hypothetical protein
LLAIRADPLAPPSTPCDLGQEVGAELPRPRQRSPLARTR